MKWIISYSIISLCSIILAFGQKTKSSRGEATEMQNSNETIEYTRNKAREAAMVNAIENAFGVIVDQQTTISMEGGSANYSVMGQKKVKGEWVREKSEPEFSYEMITVDGVPLSKVTCRVHGEVREIKHVPISFEAYPLNAPYKGNRSEVFEIDDNMFVYFRSATDGYLTLFIKEMNNVVRRILPYSRLEGAAYHGGIKIKGDTEYVFFDPEHPTTNHLGISPLQVDVLSLYTDLTSQETNTLFVIFSENPIPKPILDKATTTKEDRFIYPASMNSFKFEDWLRDTRFVDSKLQVAQFRIGINPERN